MEQESIGATPTLRVQEKVTPLYQLKNHKKWDGKPIKLNDFLTKRGITM